MIKFIFDKMFSGLDFVFNKILILFNIFYSWIFIVVGYKSISYVITMLVFSGSLFFILMLTTLLVIFLNNSILIMFSTPFLIYSTIVIYKTLERIRDIYVLGEEV